MKQLLLFSALAALLMTACQSYEADPPPGDEAALTAVQKEEITQITEDVNSGEVKNILGSLFGKQRKGRSADYTVSLLKDKQGVDRVICVNYADNGGFALISAEKTHSPILAYAEEGNFTVTDILPFPLSEWMDCTMHSIAESESLPADSLETIARMWRKYDSGIMPLVDDYPSGGGKLVNLTWDEYYVLSQIMMAKINEWNSASYRVYAIDDWTGTCSLGDKNAVGSYIQGRINPYYMDDYRSLTLVVEKDFDLGYSIGRKVKTRWTQKDGYNQSFDVMYDDFINRDRMPTGCGTIALGQIMHSFRHPNTFDWEAMTITGHGNKVTSDFLLDVYTKTKAKYLGNGETGSKQSDRMAALTEYGYTYDYVPKDGFGNVDLMKVGPVMMSSYFDNDTDKGHCWIIDGGYYADYHSETEIWSFDYSNQFCCFHSERYNEIHETRYYAIWGFDKNCDGFYLMNNMLPYGVGYKNITHKDAVINIKPIK